MSCKLALESFNVDDLAGYFLVSLDLSDLEMRSERHSKVSSFASKPNIPGSTRSASQEINDLNRSIDRSLVRSSGTSLACLFDQRRDRRGHCRALCLADRRGLHENEILQPASNGGAS